MYWEMEREVYHQPPYLRWTWKCCKMEVKGATLGCHEKLRVVVLVINLDKDVIGVMTK